MSLPALFWGLKGVAEKRKEFFRLYLEKVPFKPFQSALPSLSRFIYSIYLVYCHNTNKLCGVNDHSLFSLDKLSKEYCVEISVMSKVI